MFIKKQNSYGKVYLFSNEINNYNVGYCKTENDLLLIGENPIFHISVLNDNDFINLEDMLEKKPERNVFNNLIFAPINWNEFYYLYKNTSLW